MIKATIKWFFVFSFLVGLGLQSNEVKAKEEEIYIGKPNEAIPFPGFIKYISPYINKKVKNGFGTKDKPLELSNTNYTQNELESIKKCIILLPDVARDTFAKEVKEEDIRENTIFVNPLFHTAVKEKIGTFSPELCRKFFNISIEFQIEPLTNYFASCVVDAGLRIAYFDEKRLRVHNRYWKLKLDKNAEFTVGDYYGLFGQDSALKEEGLTLDFPNFQKLNGKGISIKITSLQGIEHTKNANHIKQVVLNQNHSILDGEYSAFPDKPFKNFTSLENLTIIGSEIKKLPEDFLEGVTTLKSINLSKNPIKVLSAGLLKDQKDLQSVWLQNNKIFFIPESFFQTNKKLERIHLENNRLKEVNPSLLNNLENLCFLNLSNNRIEEIPESFLHNLHKLTHLDLSSNKIEEFYPKTFHSCENVAELFLNNNQLTKFNKDIFLKLHKLHTLHLDHNALKLLPEKLLQSQQILESLYLQNNGLTDADLPPNLFKGLKGLKRLDLSDNQLGTFPVFSRENSLERLFLQNNNLSDESIQPKGLNLKELKIVGNRLHDINPDLLNNFFGITLEFEPQQHEKRNPITRFLSVPLPT